MNRNWNDEADEAFNNEVDEAFGDGVDEAFNDAVVNIMNGHMDSLLLPQDSVSDTILVPGVLIDLALTGTTFARKRAMCTPAIVYKGIWPG